MLETANLAYEPIWGKMICLNLDLNSSIVVSSGVRLTFPSAIWSNFSAINSTSLIQPHTRYRAIYHLVNKSSDKSKCVVVGLFLLHLSIFDAVGNFVQRSTAGARIQTVRRGLHFLMERGIKSCLTSFKPTKFVDKNLFYNLVGWCGPLFILMNCRGSH